MTKAIIIGEYASCIGLWTAKIVLNSRTGGYNRRRYGLAVRDIAACCDVDDLTKALIDGGCIAVTNLLKRAHLFHHHALAIEPLLHCIRAISSFWHN